MVRAAREEKLKELDRRMWVEADAQECWDKKSRVPIGVSWVDADKGFGVRRSRLVAKDFRHQSRVNDKEGILAATPFFGVGEMVMWVVRTTTAVVVGKVMAPVPEEECEDLPPEKAQAGTCARLLYTWDEDGCKQLGAGIQRDS